MTTTTTSTTRRQWPVALLLVSLLSSYVCADILINEIALSGTSNACNFGGEQQDWVELWNDGAETVDMTGWVLADDRGWTTLEAEPIRFPSGYVLGANAYAVVCTGGDLDQVTILTFAGDSDDANATSTTIMTRAFGIGSDDSISLVRPDDTFYTVGPFPAVPTEDVPDVTFALDPVSGSFYNYTATPTPGMPNVMTPLPTTEELIRDRKELLAAQNDRGISFFNFDRQGMPVADGMDAIVELKITMAPADFTALMDNPQYQAPYYAFTEATLVTSDGVELAVLADAGEIRTRGHEATYMAACLGSPVPFRLDFDATNDAQTLFGVHKIYLRHPLWDSSHMREWVYPRMLARFGMPHVRTRMVDFYINEQLMGFYTLMEIPEGEYVFARNFPDYDPTDFSLFQVDTLTEDCGQYGQANVQAGLDRVDELSTPPYAFERGDHIRPVTELGADNFAECQAAYEEYHNNVLMEDVVLAYVRNDEVCSETFAQEGLIDQELGTNNWDNEIENFVERFMSFRRCDPGCANSGLGGEVDVANFLKTIAFYAVTLTIDSPLGNVNNHYLAQAEGTAEKWKLVAYDFQKPGAPSCNTAICEERFIYWSIIRPTCEALESNSLVGPLLLNSTAYAEYLGYVREFLDTVYTDTAFIDQIQTHASDIQDAVEDSFGGSPGSFENELSPDSAEWNSGGFPLLPTMKARAEELQSQLAALEDGTLPRRFHMDGNDAAPWETCANWRLAEPDTSACLEGCQYDGCLLEGATIESFCEEATGTCYHGTEDRSCLGVTDGDMYTGMEEGTFCRFAAGAPVKTSVCPAPGAVASSSEAGSESSSSARRTVKGSMHYTICLALAALLLSQV